MPLRRDHATTTRMIKTHTKKYNKKERAKIKSAVSHHSSTATHHSLLKAMHCNVTWLDKGGQPGAHVHESFPLSVTHVFYLPQALREEHLFVRRPRLLLFPLRLRLAHHLASHPK